MSGLVGGLGAGFASCDTQDRRSRTRVRRMCDVHDLLHAVVFFRVGHVFRSPALRLVRELALEQSIANNTYRGSFTGLVASPEANFGIL